MCSRSLYTQLIMELLLDACEWQSVEKRGRFAGERTFDTFIKYNDSMSFVLEMSTSTDDYKEVLFVMNSLNNIV